MHPPPTLRPRSRHAKQLAAGAATALMLFLTITASTGCPGPGVLKRYRLQELNDLADHINTSTGFIGTYPEPTPARSGVDVLRSRVWVEGVVPCGVLTAADLDLIKDKVVEGPCGDI